MWFGNNLHSRVTMNKFHYIKFKIIQIGVEVLSQTQISNLKYTQRALSHKYKTKEPKIHKYQIRIAHKPKREQQIKSKSCNAPKENKSPNRRTKPSGNKPLLLFQIAIHKYQRTKQNRASFSHIHSLNLP